MKKFDVRARIITREELYAKKTGAKLPAPTEPAAPATPSVPILPQMELAIPLPAPAPAPALEPAPMPVKAPPADNIAQDDEFEPEPEPEPEPAPAPAPAMPKTPARPPSAFSFGPKAPPAQVDPEKPDNNITRVIGGAVLALSIFALAGARQ